MRANIDEFLQMDLEDYKKKKRKSGDGGWYSVENDFDIIQKENATFKTLRASATTIGHFTQKLDQVGVTHDGLI